MNKHIELVKKWIENPDSVTQEELDSNADAADDAWADDANDAWAARYIGCAARAARHAARTADAADAAYAAHWVKRYEEWTDE